MKTSGKICGQDLSAGRNSVASAVELAMGKLLRGLMKMVNEHWDTQIILLY
jgi:hypothetical protein